MAKESNPNPEVYKLLSTPEAEHLAELYLLQGDLNTAYNTFALYFEKYAARDRPREGKAAIISPSLLRDGILLFCSCFDKTAKVRLDSGAVYGHLGQDKLDYAQKLLDMRRAFVAHNYGPQRQHSVVVVCPTVDGKLVPLALTQYHIRFSGWVAEERYQLLPFIDVARNYLERLIENAEAPIMQELKSITSEELEALPDAEVVIPDPSDFNLGRSNFRKSGRGSRTPVPQRQLGRTTLKSP